MILTAFLVLIGLVMVSVYVAVALVTTGLVLSDLYAFFPLTGVIGEVSWSASTNFMLVAIPLFILMGEVLLRSGITDEMYIGLDNWFRRWPGGLMHTNIGASAMFAATSGSSVATAATVATMSLPNIERYGYRPSLFLGTVAAGGTLGILIPPSINMILYGVLSEASITQLYLAALIPGLVLAAIFSLVVVGACLLFPSWGGEKREPVPMSVKLRSLIHLVPPIGLFMVVVGSIYAGFATPTEAAALGVIAALGLAMARRRLSWKMLIAALEGTMKTTSMVMLIVIAAYFLNFVMANIGLTDVIADAISGLDWPPVAVLWLIVLLYLVLGCLMESLSLMIATTPIVVPVILTLGYDPIWFGVLFMVLIEMALITPPIGVNLFVVHSVRNKGSFNEVGAGSVPFVVAMLVMVGLLIAFPELAMWLPQWWGK